MGKKPKALLFIEFREKLDSINSAKEAGFKTVLITKKAKPEAYEIFDYVIETDITKRENVDRMIEILNNSYSIRGILTNYEHYVVQRSYLAERFGLLSCSVYAACCTRNKVMQRNMLSLLPENIEYRIANTKRDALQAFNDLGGDVYMKSVAGIKSRYIFHVKSKQELEKSWQIFRAAKLHLDEDLYNDFSYFDFQFTYPDPKKNILIEKACYGQQIAVSSLVSIHNVWHTPSVTDVYTAKSIGRDDSFLAFRILPSKYPKDILDKAEAVVETVVGVSGLQYCAVFADLLLTEAGDIKIIEVASRIGGYRPLMYREVYDIDLTALLIKTVAGELVKSRRKPKKFVSLMEIFPKGKGKFVKVKNVEILEKDINVSNLKFRVQTGDLIGMARENFPPVLVFLISGVSYEEVYEKSLKYQREIEVVVS